MPVIRRGAGRRPGRRGGDQTRSPEAAQWDPTGYLDYDLLVAVEQEQVAGFLVWRLTDAGEGEILNLAVAPEFRRAGLARRLVGALLSGYRGYIFLEVRESNRAARNLYKSLGFYEVGCRPGYYEKPLEAAIVMKFHSC